MTDNDTAPTGVDSAPAAPSAPVVQDVLYKGVQPPGGGPGRITISTLTGHEIATVAHFAKHSPTGMGWGYRGSGASDCARSLLAAAIGEQLAVCLICKGTTKVVFGENRPPNDTDPLSKIKMCEFCDGGLSVPPAVYHTFKDVFVAVWDDTFVITRGAIVGWLKHRFPERTWPTVVD